MVMAPLGHLRMHMPQPRQPAEQAAFTAGPLSWLEQLTRTGMLYGRIEMMWLGQAFAQAEQPVQRA